MTVNEYITMDLLLPLAMGLAGAALYHLGTAFFRYIFDVEAYDPKNVMHLDGWAREDLMKADAVANVRLNALEERMGKVEEIANTRVTRWASAEDVDTIQVWPSDGYVKTSGVPYAFAGKPCPRPTKDLRPGDEVSVRVQITTIGESCIHAGAGKVGCVTSPYVHLVAKPEELDDLRTDNK